TITCPHCGFSRTVRKSAIPHGSMSATCPKCRMAFAFSTVDPTGEPLPAHKTIDREGGAAPPAPPNPEATSQENAADPPPIRAEAPARPAGPSTLSFSFQGSGREYFGIWIVNTLLKIVTCGIYSAWAKVRKRRYFYGSTKLQGEPFEYLADPLALFKGWLIGAAAFLLYIIANRTSPSLSMVIGLVIFIALPWLVVRSRMFNLRNSSHRNIRFSFRPVYQEAYLVFLLLPILSIFTLFLLIPYVIYRQKKFLVENSSYGMTPFTFDAKATSFYLLFLRATVGAVALVALFSFLFYLAAGGNSGILGTITAKKPEGLKFLTVFPMLFFILLYFYIATYMRTAMSNLTWNGTSLSGCRFNSTLRTLDMVWLYLSNAVAIACTLGLLIPWAAVRMARYRFERLDARTQEGLEDFFALARNEEVTATGEEIGDIFGVNVDFGF
ncbi:MAG TPA: DUF898 family protein, partial [Geobacteraceae bacterium]|nr:DUF898 family protein [Geobacteraceae bacterium]